MALLAKLEGAEVVVGEVARELLEEGDLDVDIVAIDGAAVLPGPLRVLELDEELELNFEFEERSGGSISIGTNADQSSIW